ncbi:Ig-like domain-containing protein [Bacillus thuringiensis]|uniref:Ig-like domain-containing protein n=1 Tax=Bacillus thuringiensis TaxID=1428 RepID=UPI0021D6676D|nr:Ig-like domain-containing protein [Bacillus thuringiensis]MCU7667674.1 Ig-like domain-containing protein [Bacillus thuringiensis]
MKRLFWLIIPLVIIVFVILYKLDVIANFKGESKSAVTEPKDSDSYFSYSLVSDIPTKHKWELNFPKELDSKTVSKSNVYVKDEDKNEVKVKSEVSQDGKTLLISPPENGYKEGTRYTIYVEKGLQYKDGKRDEQAAKMPFVTTRKDNEKLELKKNLVHLKADAIKSHQGNQIVVDKAAVDKPIKKQTPLIIPTNDQYEPEQAVVVDTIKEEGSTYVITYKEANVKDIVDVIDIYKVLKIDDGTIVPDKNLQGIEITKTNSNGVVKANIEDKKQDFLVQAPLDLSNYLKPHELQNPEQVNVSVETPNSHSLGLGNEIVFSNPSLNQLSSPLAESMKSKPEFKWNKETDINNRGEKSIEVDGLDITNPIGFKIKFNNFTIPKDNQNFVMDGEITIDPDLLFDVQYSWGRIKQINIGQKLTTVESGKLSIIPKDKNSNFANMEVKQHIFDVYFPIFTAIKGKLEFYFYMSWDYKRMQPVVQVKAEQSAKAGVYVKKNDIEPYSGFDHKEDVMLSGQTSFENREGVGAEISAKIFKAPLAGVEANAGLYVEAKATAGAQIGDDMQAATCLRAEVGPFVNSKANIYLFNDDKWSYKIFDEKYPARELGSSCTELTSIELDTDKLNFDSSTETLKLDSDEERTLKVMGVYSDKFELKKDKVNLLEDSKKKKNLKFKVEDATVATISADGKIKAGQNPNSGETKVNITYTENKKERKMSFTVKLSEVAGKTKIPKTNPEVLDYEKTFNELFSGIRKTVFGNQDPATPLPDFSTVSDKLSQYATDSYMNNVLKGYYQQSRGWMDGLPIPYQAFADTCSKQGDNVTCKLIELSDAYGSKIHDATMVKQNGKWLISKLSSKDLNEITYKQAARALEQQGYKVNNYLGERKSTIRPKGVDYTFDVVSPDGKKQEFSFPSTSQ